MTKAQAREYATRIRLGEQLWFSDDGWDKPGAIWLGGTVVYYWAKNATWWRIPRPDDPACTNPPVALGYQCDFVASVGLLAALDQVANS
jgi:hypothetical protein